MSELLAKDMPEIEPIDSIGRVLQFLADLHVEVSAKRSKPFNDMVRGSLRSEAFAATIVPRLLTSHSLTASKLYAFTNWLQLVLKQTPALEEPTALNLAPTRRNPRVVASKSRRLRPHELEVEDEEDSESVPLKTKRRRRRSSRVGVVDATETDSASSGATRVFTTSGIGSRTYEVQDHSEVPLAFRTRRKRVPGQVEDQDIEFDSIGEKPSRTARSRARLGAAPIALGIGAGVAGMYLGSRGGPFGLANQPGIGPLAERGLGAPQLGISSQPLGRTATNLADSLILRNGARGSAGLSQDLLKMRRDPSQSNLNQNSAVSAHPRLGHVTLVSSPIRVAGKDSSKAGVDATFQMKDLAKGARPLTFDDIKALKATLPAGAKALYPSLHPNDLGPSAVNVPISAEVINALLDHQGETPSPGFADKVVSLSWPSPVMSALRADVGMPNQPANLSSGPSTLGQGRTHRWSGNYHSSGGGPSVLRTLGLPVYLPGGVNQPHPLSYAQEARADLRMVPVRSIPATTFAQMRQQAFPNFHSVIANASAPALPRIMPTSTSQGPTYHAPRVSAPPSQGGGFAAIPSRVSAAGHGPSRASAGVVGHPAVPHIPARSLSTGSPMAPRLLSPASGASHAKPSGRPAMTPSIGMAAPVIKPIVPSHPAIPPTMTQPLIPKAPTVVPSSPHVDMRIDLPPPARMDLGDHQEKPKTTLISASLSKPAMPLKKPIHHDDQAIAVQASKGGIGAASESQAKTEEQASQVGGAKAKDQDVNLLATEVWSLLKRKLQFESERAGFR
ncbi:MAG: hypothetical protein H7Y17_09190 [Chlorobia bacterium]|nr:hypothetical protein [Fimbriimonadaceae bacterium]